MKDRISYEERRKNIDRVMKMTQKCDSAKKDRRDNAKNTNGESFPKHESHQKRQPCMTRKKQIGAKNGLPNDVWRIFGNDLHWERSDMRQADKDRADKNEECDALERKRESSWLDKPKKNDDDPKYDSPVGKQAINIKCPNITQEYIGNRVTCVFNCINVRIETYHKTRD